MRVVSIMKHTQISKFYKRFCFTVQEQFNFQIFINCVSKVLIQSKYYTMICIFKCNTWTKNFDNTVFYQTAWILSTIQLCIFNITEAERRLSLEVLSYSSWILWLLYHRRAVYCLKNAAFFFR